MNLEWPMIVISLAYLLSLLIRVNDFDHEITKVFLFAAATIIQTAFLYLFVFYMLRYRLIIESESPAHLNAGKSTLNKLMVVVGVAFAI